MEVWIGFGSNVGDREAQLTNAKGRLAQGGWVRWKECSSLLETEPWGPVAQGWYLNQLCRGKSDLTAPELMRVLLDVEALGGRDRAREERWGPRPIDIDLLAYGDQIYQDNLVEVPHPRLHLRRFILQPWAELAPEWRHPVLDRSIQELLDKVEDDGRIRLVAERQGPEENSRTQGY